MPAPPNYASFLVRLWREGDPELKSLPAGWQGEFEHIQTSRRWTFSTWDQLLGRLRQATEETDTPGRVASR
jgi:hypothetical protein